MLGYMSLDANCLLEFTIFLGNCSLFGIGHAQINPGIFSCRMEAMGYIYWTLLNEYAPNLVLYI